MAEVAVTLKLAAREFIVLREEIKELAIRKHQEANAADRGPEQRAMVRRAVELSEISEKLG